MSAPDSPVAPPRLVLTVEEAAKLLSIGRTLAYELVRRGEFPTPVVRAGARYLVPVAGVAVALGIQAREGDVLTAGRLLGASQTSEETSIDRGPA